MGPTPVPSPNPTMSPTWACPRYWFIGGTSQAICDTNDDSSESGYIGGDRCACHDSTRDQCCLLEPDFTTTWDPNRRHKTDANCKLDVQLEDWEDGRTDDDDDGSPGYLLTTEQHTFRVDISPENYPCRMDIFWRLKFDCLDLSYDNDRRRRRLQNCAESGATLSAAGLRILDADGNPSTSGWLKVWGQQD